jgi:hypothetical protein
MIEFMRGIRTPLSTMVQRGAWQRVQQSRQPGPVGRAELHPVAVQLPVQDHDLMP